MYTSPQIQDIVYLRVQDVDIGSIFRFNRIWCVRDSSTFYSWSIGHKNYCEEIHYIRNHMVAVKKGY